jgi:serine/threonine protein phosphatase PrpC
MANTNFDGDSVLGLSEKENIYQVTNQQTGYTQPISSDEITEKIGTEYQYALPIRCDF